MFVFRGPQWGVNRYASSTERRIDSYELNAGVQYSRLDYWEYQTTVNDMKTSNIQHFNTHAVMVKCKAKLYFTTFAIKINRMETGR